MTLRIKIKMSKGVCNLEKAQAKLNKLGIIIKCDTYTMFTKKCILIDPTYGEWEATPSTVYKNKSKHPKKAAIERGKTISLSDEFINKTLSSRRIKMKEGSYDRKTRIATFIDYEYGEWTSNFSNVFYLGSEHPDKAQIKRSLSCNNRYETNHWKTKMPIVCVGSYEKFIINKLNSYEIDYDWQIPFSLSSGKKYYIDLYIKEFNIYVEVKGRYYPDWVEKHNIFLKDYPYLNYIICNENIMKQLGYKRSRHE